MKIMNITSFKTHALRVISKVAELHESVIITKRGKALAEIIPYKPHSKKAKPGKLASTLVSEKDVVSPISEEWKANN